MKRTAGAWLLLAALSGCVSMEYNSDGPRGCCGGGSPPAVPGVQGPWGQPVPMVAPYSAAPPTDNVARAMMSQSIPLNAVQPQTGVMQASASVVPGSPSGVTQAGGPCPAGGCPPNLQAPPGAITPPGVPYAPGMPPGGAQPGVPFAPGSIRAGPPGAVAAVGALTGAHAGQQFPTQRTSVRFTAPVGMKLSWYAPGPDGKPTFSTTPLEVPGRYNFAQAAIYRLKLSAIPKHPELELYPTLEVVPANSRTSTFLAHTSVPLTFTEEDFEQVAAGNYLVKVIYLPDPQFQDAASTGVDEILSTRLDPGVDPIQEACRRGSILLVIRMGNIDLELSNSPAMDAPSPYTPRAVPPHQEGMGPGGPRPGPMVPYGMIAPGGRPAAPNAVPYGAGAGVPRLPNLGNPAGQPGAMLPPPQNGSIAVPPATGASPQAIPGVPVSKLPSGFVIDLYCILMSALITYRLNLAAQMVRQYPWLYERFLLFGWRARRAR